MAGGFADVTLVGHPYAPIGMGEHLRCTFRAMRSVGVRPKLIDLYQLHLPEPEQLCEFGPAISDATNGVEIHHLNGDELPQSEVTMAARFGPPSRYRIIYPLWELSRYPEEWARGLEKFDEIWAPSRFIFDALVSVVSKPVIHMPLASEAIITNFLSRRWFGIEENSYVFLFFFDVRSYVERKNPQGVLAAFRKLVSARPYGKFTLVLKVNSDQKNDSAAQDLRRACADLGARVMFIDKTLSDNETKNLIRNCDCFISLHRSEGFGKGLCEAMSLGKPVIGTAYSGNLDFMNHENALMVDFKEIPVSPGQYPYAEGQVWADPSVEHACTQMTKLVDNPSLGAGLGREALLTTRLHFSYRAAGARYLKRLSEINNLKQGCLI
jgi:glycosyltransferase involved in cell wall biosynthesis